MCHKPLYSIPASASCFGEFLPHCLTCTPQTWGQSIPSSRTCKEELHIAALYKQGMLAGFAPPSRYGAGPPGAASAPPAGPQPPGMAPAGPQPPSMAPAGPKAGYGSGYNNTFSRPAAASYAHPQHNSQQAQARSGPRPSQGFSHQGGSSGAASSQGPRAGPGHQSSQVS